MVNPAKLLYLICLERVNNVHREYCIVFRTKLRVYTAIQCDNKYNESSRYVLK